MYILGAKVESKIIDCSNFIYQTNVTDMSSQIFFLKKLSNNIYISRGEKNMHKKKMIAPIVITAVIVLYYIGFALLCAFEEGIPLYVKLLSGIIPLLLAGASIYVLFERIKEIRSGEEDDLSKY